MKRTNQNRIYRIYCNIKYRCYTKTCPFYNRYGGRGITMCDEWLEDYYNFEKWALENGYADNLCVDRIDNDGNYEPDNCQWITIGENTGRANKIHQHRHANKSDWYYGISPDGTYYEFDNASQFARGHPELDDKLIRRAAYKNIRHKNW